MFLRILHVVLSVLLQILSHHKSDPSLPGSHLSGRLGIHKIIQLKCILSGKNRLSVLLHLFFHVCKNRKSLVDRLIKLCFFFCDYIKDKVFLFFQFRISVFRSVNDSLCKFYKECSLDSKKSSMTACTAEKTARTYPLPSLDGIIPSEIMKDTERTWSVITRRDTSVLSLSP